MKKFDKDNKVNFVDENNVLVGYETKSQCCEGYGTIISRDLSTVFDHLSLESIISEDIQDIQDNIQLESWVFDPAFFARSLIQGPNEEVDCCLAIFRITNDHDSAFLILYNVHNGYYTHGFSMFEDGTIIRQGRL